MTSSTITPPESLTASTSVGRERQGVIYSEGLAGRHAKISASPAKLEAAGREAMGPLAWAYIGGGATSEVTMDSNRAAFNRVKIVPRMLRDVSKRDTSVTVFGRTFPAPFATAPIGVLEMCHREADLAVAKGASSLGVPVVFSSQASVPMEACAAAMGDSPRWYQLYWSTENRIVESFVRRAERIGCEAIVLTLDTTMLGWRPQDLDFGHLPFLHARGIAQYTSDPVFNELVDADLASPIKEERTTRVTPTAISALWKMSGRLPGKRLNNLRSGRAIASVKRFIDTYSRPSLSWDDLAFLRELTDLPILLKGIVHPDDARLAIDYGMNGIVVSNHGGRQVDGSVGTLDQLPAIVEAVDGRIPIVLDSGVRTGADIFKAIALGADMVFVGRPYTYGLAIDGADGVRSVLQNIHADFDLSMGLAGCARVSDINRDSVLA